MGPYIVDGHYMYGNTYCIDQHKPPYYNTICHHLAPALRGFPPRMIANHQGDGVGYSEPESMNQTDSDGTCTAVVRSSSMPNVVSVTARKITTLRIKIWGTKSTEDYTTDLELGNRYAITYLTPGGFAVADGYLTYIDSSISDDCTTYVGNYSEDVVQSYIGLDCSTKGKSDKRKIYISSIRKIEALEADAEYEPGIEVDGLSTDDRINAVLKQIIRMNCILESGIIGIGDDISTDVGEVSDEDLELIIMGDDKCHCGCGGGEQPEDPGNPPNVTTNPAVYYFVKQANSVIAQLKDIAEKMFNLGSGTVDESTDDGTYADLMLLELDERVLKTIEGVMNVNDALAASLSGFDLCNVSDSDEVIITKKLAIILRWVAVIDNSLVMLDPDKDEDGSSDDNTSTEDPSEETPTENPTETPTDDQEETEGGTETDDEGTSDTEPVD